LLIRVGGTVTAFRFLPRFDDGASDGATAGDCVDRLIESKMLNAVCDKAAAAVVESVLSADRIAAASIAAGVATETVELAPTGPFEGWPGPVIIGGAGTRKVGVTMLAMPCEVIGGSTIRALLDD